MKAQTISITLATCAALLGAGCASDTYDNTNRNRGAVAGAAAGAVLGGVIAANSDKATTEQGAAVGAVAGGLAGAAIGNRQDRRTSATGAPPVYSSADAGYTVQTVPPAPVSEPQESMPPQPSPNAMWIRGHYVWTGNGYQWQPGRWEVPPTGARVWVPPAWQPAANGGYVYVRGHWQ
jgi:hypothetical protein